MILLLDRKSIIIIVGSNTGTNVFSHNLDESKKLLDAIYGFSISKTNTIKRAIVILSH